MKEEEFIQIEEFIESKETYPAKLAVIGGAITTLGDALTSLASMSDELVGQNSNEEALEFQKNQTIQLDRMQRQIDYLTKKIAKLERRKL